MRMRFLTIGALAVAATTATARPLRQNPDLLLPERTRGSAEAPITIYEIADFQCPACRMFFTETEPALMRDYVATGKARFIYVNFPLVQLHQNAAAAHEFAMCAARQNHFWPIHDLLYRHQDSWATLADPAPYFYQLADSAKLDTPALKACLSSGVERDLIQAEAQAAYRAGVNSTPSFIINGALLRGAAPISAWKPILDSIYAKATADTASGKR